MLRNPCSFLHPVLVQRTCSFLRSSETSEACWQLLPLSRPVYYAVLCILAVTCWQLMPTSRPVTLAVLRRREWPPPDEVLWCAVFSSLIQAQTRKTTETACLSSISCPTRSTHSYPQETTSASMTCLLLPCRTSHVCKQPACCLPLRRIRCILAFKCPHHQVYIGRARYFEFVLRVCVRCLLSARLNAYLLIHALHHSSASLPRPTTPTMYCVCTVCRSLSAFLLASPPLRRIHHSRARVVHPTTLNLHDVCAVVASL